MDQMQDVNLTPMFSSSRRKSASRDQIASYFHLPIAAASREIGICATLLKKICRKYGIPRWPFRKLKSIEKAMVNLIDSLRSMPQEESSVLTQLLRLQRQKENILFGFAKTASNAVPAGMSPDDLIKFFQLESVATSAESFSDEDEEDSGSNDRKAQNKAQNAYMKDADIISFAVSAVQKKTTPSQDPTAMKYFEPQRQAGFGSNLRSTVPPYGIAPHMVVAYPRSVSPPTASPVPSWSNPMPKPDVTPTLPAAVSPTISPLKAVASSNLFNFKLAPSLGDYSCRRSIDFSGEPQTTSANYSNSGDSSPPLPAWFKQEQLAARQIQAKLNLA